MNKLAAIDLNTHLETYPEELTNREFQKQLDEMIAHFVEGSLQMLSSALQAADLCDSLNGTETMKAMAKEVATDSFELFELRMVEFSDFCETINPKYL